MNDLLQKLWQQLAADKKKLGIMLGLACIGLLLWGRLLLKQVPRTATADPQTSVQADSTSTAPSTRIMPPPLAEDLGYGRDQTSTAMTVTLNAPNRLGRDLFNWDGGPYRHVESADQPPRRQKQAQPTADRQFRIAQARDAGRNLTLESVIGGKVPAAIINGKVLRKGQTIKSFTVSRIAKRYVILEMNGIRFRLAIRQ